MDLQTLRYCVILSRTLSFRKAAERANVTQPTLSQQLKKLEQELGVALFERTTQRVALTEAGRRFLPRAVAVLDQARRAADEAQESSREARGAVEIGVIPTICPYLMPQVICRLKKTAPRLTLTLREETTSVLLDHLKAGDLDIGILSLPIKDPGIAALSLGREPFFLAVGRRHRLSRRRRVSPKEVGRERLLILQEGHCFRDQSLEYCKRKPEDPRVIFQGGSLTSVVELAASGEGVTLVPRMAAQRLRSGRVRILPFTSPEPTRELGIVWRTGAPPGPAQRAVMEAAARALKKSV